MLNAIWHEMARIRTGRTKRASSWDRTGGNYDAVGIAPGETRVLADIGGPGVINHIYFTMITPALWDYRDAVLRMFWDGEDTPSVEAPFGDFFCIGNCTVRRFASLMVAVNAGSGPLHANNGYNCYFPMPFARGARIEIENQSERWLGGLPAALWYHIDYEELDAPPDNAIGRFHAQWRRENLTVVSDAVKKTMENKEPNLNLTGDENYVMLEAQGEGHIAGLFLEVNNVQGGWYGEGDDMMFIDGDTWPPSQHGTGTEEVFGGGAGPNVEYAGPYTGFLLVENRDGEQYKGLNAMYRWYVQDPIRFHKSVRMSIEHGHGNDFANDYASVAYWYQKEPHAPFPELLPIAARRPIAPEDFNKAMTAHEELVTTYVPAVQRMFAEAKGEPEWLPTVREKAAAADSAIDGADYAKAEACYIEALAAIQKGK
ncbi:MAG TPA: DUF2961 domain-containing protein [Candidatus Hydrogenedentes bacterium]|nr:DUF2961 domain-containing protein [Candidatus Hydrogenedentota bacterium]HIJ74868.1 DUF2961 domain-containing protein [Candidatus Hydrogenedentota bacterium]